MSKVKIPDFENLSYPQRRSQVSQLRKSELYSLQKTNNPSLKQTKKNYEKTDVYIHLTLSERNQLLLDLATAVGNWGFARLFAECVDKIHFDPSRSKYSLDEHAFDQIVSRFEKFLQLKESKSQNFGLLVHDNNQTVAKKHTILMHKFHRNGTLWTTIKNIIETPLFVDSQLTSRFKLLIFVPTHFDVILKITKAFYLIKYLSVPTADTELQWVCGTSQMSNVSVPYVRAIVKLKVKHALGKFRYRPRKRKP